jgi:hypothetical protein
MGFDGYPKPGDLPALDEINDLRAQVARLEQEKAAALVPICVGKEVIAWLASQGAWKADDGRAVVAADELFHNDPYLEIAGLRAALDIEKRGHQCASDRAAVLTEEVERLKADALQRGSE